MLKWKYLKWVEAALIVKYVQRVLREYLGSSNDTAVEFRLLTPCLYDIHVIAIFNVKYYVL